MPLLNERADYSAGGGGSPGSVNGHYYPFGSYGRGCWPDPDVIVVAKADNSGVWAWRWREDPTGAALLHLDPRPTSGMAAGGGKYAAIMPPTPTSPSVLFGSLGDIVGAGAADIASDGTIVYKMDYNGTYGLTVVHPNGTRVDLPNALAVDVQALPGGKAIWRGGAHGRDPVKPFYPDAIDVKLCTAVDGTEWLQYWVGSLKSVIVQPNGTSEGYRFSSESMWNRHMIVGGAAVLFIWAWTDGEAPSDVVLADLSRVGISYWVGNGPVPAWESFVVPPEPPIPPEPVEPLEVTIRSYAPTNGVAPLTVTAVAEVTSGQVDTFVWRWRPLGALDWRVDAENPANDLDHNYHFLEMGTYEISLRAVGPSGDAVTGAQRLVEVTTPPPPIPPKPEPEKIMLYLDKLDKNVSAYKCEVVENDNGTISLRTHDGKIVTVTPEGEWRDDPESSLGQAWQQFIRTPTALVAEREMNGVWTFYLRPYVEVK